MPRFRLLTLLIVVTVVALWLSTLTEYGGAEDVRTFIMLGCLITSGVAAWSYTAHRRAFWLGFFGTMLALAVKGVLVSYGASFTWAPKVSRDLSQYIKVEQLKSGRLMMGINLTIIFALTLVAATLIGLMCVYVYHRATKDR
jgi:hypothetical protein